MYKRINDKIYYLNKKSLLEKDKYDLKNIQNKIINEMNKYSLKKKINLAETACQSCQLFFFIILVVIAWWFDLKK